MGARGRSGGMLSERRKVKASDWLDGRLGFYTFSRTMMRRAYPDHWSFVLGEICLFSFLLLIITGIYLTFLFHPSANQVVYHGSYAPLRGRLVSEAFDSALRISFEVRGGLLIRQAHHWATLVFMASVFVHMMRVFFTGAFRKPREFNWVFGFLLLVLGMFEGLTGYDLPDDQLSGTGLAIINGALLSVPVVGTYLSMFLFGGEFPGTDMVARFNAIHILLLPGIMVGLVSVHMFLAVYHKHTQYPGPGRSNKNAVGMPLRTYAASSTAYFFLLSGVVFIMAAVAQINPIWGYGPFRPDQAYAGSQPDWYMGFLDGYLRVMPGWEINFLGHTLALDNFIPLLAGGVLLMSIGVYPFIESWATNDDGSHHLIDRARNRPVRTGFGAAWISGYLVAQAGASNDLIATRFRVSLNDVTWAVRIGILVVPALVFIVTKRWALGLQRRDRDKVLHGRETGVVKRLSHGEYIEVHEPLSQAELYTMTAHEQYRPIEAAPPGPSGRPGRTARLRVRISQLLYGPGTQIAKPTAEEYEELTEGH